jgi:hypothetical protein
MTLQRMDTIGVPHGRKLRRRLKSCAMCGRYVPHGNQQCNAGAPGLPHDEALGSSVFGTWHMTPSQCSY